MATRKVIDAKQNGEKVWLKGHAQATYMSNGSTVEEAINSIQIGSGGIATETDPIFSASPAASITEEKKAEWDNKMDKVILSPVATSGNYNDLSNKPFKSLVYNGDYIHIDDGLAYNTAYDVPIVDSSGYIKSIRGLEYAYEKVSFSTSGITFIPEEEGPDTPRWSIHRNGDGTKFLSDDGTYKNISGGGGTSNANIQAVVREGYQEPEVRPLRDAVDLSTGEKIYFAGDAQYICVNGNATLLDYIDDKVAAIRIIKWDVETGSVDNIPEEVYNWIYIQEGILMLNGSVAILVTNEDTGAVSIQSSVIKDNTIFVTKVFLTMLGYDSDLVTIDSYPISGGSGGSSSSGVTSVKINGQSKSPSSGVVDLGYINKQLSTSTSSSMTLSPNIYYRNTSTSLSSLTITLGSVSNSNIINEYFVEFTTSSSGTTVTLPTGIKWANGEAPTFEASTTYQISIVNNLGTYQKFK